MALDHALAIVLGDRLAIVRMDAAQEGLDIPFGLQFGEAEDPVVTNRAMGRPGAQVQVPIADLRHLQREAQARLAFAKRGHHALLRGDVARDLRPADDASLAVADRRDGHREVETASVLAESHRVERRHDFPVDDIGQDVQFLLATLFRNQHRHGLPERLLLGVAEQLLRRVVPCRDGAVERLADDGVAGRLHDRREPAHVHLGTIDGAQVLQYHHEAANLSVIVSHQGGIDLDGHLRTRPGKDVEAVFRIHRDALFEHDVDDVVDAGGHDTVHSIQYLQERLAEGLRLRPAGDALRDRVQPDDVARNVGGDHAGVDGRERERELLFDVRGVLLGIPAERNLRFEVSNGALQGIDARDAGRRGYQPPGCDSRRQGHCRCHDLRERLEPIVGVPDRPDIHRVRHAAGEDECAEQDRHGGEPRIGPAALECQDGKGNRQVGQHDHRVGRHHRPEHARRPREAVAVRQVAVSTKERGQIHTASRSVSGCPESIKSKDASAVLARECPMALPPIPIAANYHFQPNVRPLEAGGDTTGPQVCRGRLCAYPRQ